MKPKPPTDTELLNWFSRHALYVEREWNTEGLNWRLVTNDKYGGPGKNYWGRTLRDCIRKPMKPFRTKKKK